MASQVSQLQLLSAVGAAVAIVLSVSGSCDKAIETRITAVRDQATIRMNGLEDRIELLEHDNDR